MYRLHGKEVFSDVAEVLEPAHCALLVIDMQNDLISENGAYARGGDDTAAVQAVVPTVAALVETARSSDVPVIYTQNTTLPDGRSDSSAWIYFKNYSRPSLASEYTVAGTWGHRIVDELAPQPGEVVVTKHRSDAFVGTDLDLVLRAAGVATVVTTGIVTNGCVESTVRHAAFLDYYSVLVEDACASNSENLQQAAVSLLRGRHDVVTTAVVTQCWRNS